MLRPGGYLFVREVDFSGSTKSCQCRNEIIADEKARKLLAWKKQVVEAAAAAATIAEAEKAAGKPPTVAAPTPVTEPEQEDEDVTCP